MAKSKHRPSPTSTSTSASQRREAMKKQRIQRESDEMKKQRQRVDDPQKRRRYAASNRIPWGLIVGALLIILAVVGVIIYLSQQSGSSTGTAAKPTPVSATVLDSVTHVSPSVLSAVGTGGQQKLLTSIRKSSPPPLVGPTGKPEFFYFGAEYCPYCAAERWAIVVSLSQFGTFNKLNQITSSSTDVYPSTPTFTFYQSTYTSQYIDFVSVESTTNQSDGNGGYTTLQTLTTEQTQLLTKYDAPPYVPSTSAGSFPFIDVANQMMMQGANYSPQLLSNLSWDEIASDLTNPSSDVTKGIVGSANYLTAAICMSTNQKPASVCTAAPIPAIEQSLGTASVAPSNQQLGVVSPITEAVLRRPE